MASSEYWYEVPEIRNPTGFEVTVRGNAGSYEGVKGYNSSSVLGKGIREVQRISFATRDRALAFFEDCEEQYPGDLKVRIFAVECFDRMRALLQENKGIEL